MLLTPLPAPAQARPADDVRNPVMFVVEVGAVCTTVLAIARPERASPGSITVWLWLTVVFANLAEAVAEGRGKAQAETLRRTPSTETMRPSAGSATAYARSRSPAADARRSATSWSSRPAR